MDSFATIIDRFGVPVLAKMFGVDESHIRVMKARDSIPPEYWGQIIEAAPRHSVNGVTYRMLRKLRAARFDRASQPDQRVQAAS